MAQTLLDKVWDAPPFGNCRTGSPSCSSACTWYTRSPVPGLPDARRARPVGALSRPHLRHRRPHHPDRRVARPYVDGMAEQMFVAIEQNVEQTGIPFFDRSTGRQGIVHVIGPELGLTQPGMTIACGDSHTSTHGAFGAIAFGIGTSQVRDVLATQTISVAKPQCRRISVNGKLAEACSPRTSSWPSSGGSACRVGSLCLRVRR